MSPVDYVLLVGGAALLVAGAVAVAVMIRSGRMD
jgi:hypothetical protein